SSGHKTIDGGAGNDAITVTVGPASIFGGAGDDVIAGGSGNDILYGEGGANEIHGGGGSDILVSANDAAYWEDGQWHRSDQLSGGAGSDRIVLNGIGARAEGGAGDDLIELRGSPFMRQATVAFGHGDGHDTLLGAWGNSQAAAEDWANNFLLNSRHALVDLSTISMSEVDLIWDMTEYSVEVDGNLRRVGIGDLAVVIRSSGESVLLQNVIFDVPHFDEARPNYVGLSSGLGFPRLLFSEGYFAIDDGYANMPISIGSTAAYSTASSAFALEQAAGGSLPPGAQTGTPGDDDLAGSYGDDTLNGGDGDDNFTESGGQDSYEGGLGLNSLNLFGSPSDYRYADEDGRLVVINPRTGGRMTLANIEFVYFTAEAATLTEAGLLAMVGTEGDDILVGSAYGDVLDGLAGDDAVDGGAGDDLLIGGAGNDELTGGDGDDLFEGLEGLDQIDGGGGEDRLVLAGGRSDYSFVPNADGALVYGPGGYDSAFLSSVDSVYFAADDALVPLIELTALHGTEEGDALGGFERADLIYGHGGDDLVFGSGGADLLYGGEGADTLYGGTGNDLLDGGGGDDMLVGDEGDDTLRESGGADLLTAGDGDDRVVLSGTRADYLFAWDYGSVRVERPGDGPLTLISVESVYFEGEDLLVPILDLVAINGTGDADMLDGTAARDLILGHDGDDSIQGNDGDDEIDGGGGVDTAHYAGASADFLISREQDGSISIGDIWGSEGWDSLADVEYLYFAGDDVLLAVADLPARGTEGDDVIVGSDRGDSLLGEGGDDSISGLGGNDSISGGSGADLMSGGAGDDEYFVDDAGDVVVEDAHGGYDFVVASVDFMMSAEVEALMIWGDATVAIGNALDNCIGGNSWLSSHLRGLAGDDNLGGGQEGDILEGGDGADVLAGWGGADVFLYRALSDSTAAASDAIWVFEPGTDTIDLGEIDADTSSLGDQAFTFLGTSEFSASGASAPGELRAFLVSDTLWQVEADGDLDGVADFLIQVFVDGAEPLTASDFLL
ncbi:MAG: hypothetical protein QOI38_2010, partial [Sphingomonadales bacterium]|nr:hypothetical protein [Sphingomonadales bacterium]